MIAFLEWHAVFAFCYLAFRGFSGLLFIKYDDSMLRSVSRCSSQLQLYPAAPIGDLMVLNKDCLLSRTVVVWPPPCAPGSGPMPQSESKIIYLLAPIDFLSSFLRVTSVGLAVLIFLKIFFYYLLRLPLMLFVVKFLAFSIFGDAVIEVTV